MKQWPQSLAKVVSERMSDELLVCRGAIKRLWNSKGALNIPMIRVGADDKLKFVGHLIKIVTALELASVKTRNDWPTSIYFYRITSQKICMTN